MKKTISILLCGVLLSAAFPLRAAAAKAAATLSVSAEAAILYEPTCGRVPFEKNADRRLPMASTTKLMTAMVAASLAPLDRVVTVPREAVGIEGSSLYLGGGETLTVRELLYALLLRSANDAATALAVTLAGSVDAFVAEMNREAARLGCVNTHFENPHGLDADGHHTTARDLAVMMAAFAAHGDLMEIAGTKRYALKLGDVTQVLTNHNRMLTLDVGVAAGKTGFTKSAGRCLACYAVCDGVPLVTVTLSAPDDWNDHCAMLRYGATQYEMTVLTAGGYRIPLSGGTEGVAECHAAASIVLPMPRGGSSDVETKLTLPSHLYAPLAAGDALGYLEILYGGETVAETALLCDRSIPTQNENQRGLRRLFRWLR